MLEQEFKLRFPCGTELKYISNVIEHMTGQITRIVTNCDTGWTKTIHTGTPLVSLYGALKNRLIIILQHYIWIHILMLCYLEFYNVIV